MTTFIIDKGPTKLTVAGISFFEVRTYLGVFLGAFSDENAAWGVERQANITLQIEKMLDTQRDVNKEEWYQATLTLADGTVISRYAARVSESWSKAFDSPDKLSKALADEFPDEVMPPPGM